MDLSPAADPPPPFINALSEMTFSGSLKIPNKVKKINATIRIHSKWNLYL
jgi:hypothetical protein